jgi:hypothetical protein
VNQHQLAARLKRSRASIIAWAKDGMPVAKRGGPGRATFYDLDKVVAWIGETGRGIRAELPPMPPLERADVYTTSGRPPLIEPAELLLGRVLEAGLGGIVATLIGAGVPDEIALEAFDGLVVAAYSVLELETGKEDSLIPMDGALRLLMDDGGRAQIIAHARKVAAANGSARITAEAH